MSPPEKSLPPKSPSPSRAAQGSLREDLALLFRAIVYQIPYIRFRDRLQADRFEQLVNLCIWDKYWEVDEDPAEADRLKADWLEAHVARLEVLRNLPEYKEIANEVEMAFDKVAEAQEMGYKSLVQDKALQWRVFEHNRRLAYHATDERVQQKALEAMTDRIAGRLTAKEGGSGAVVINIGEVVGATIAKALEEYKEVKELTAGEYSIADAPEAP